MCLITVFVITVKPRLALALLTSKKNVLHVTIKTVLTVMFLINVLNAKKDLLFQKILLVETLIPNKNLLMTLCLNMIGRI